MLHDPIHGRLNARVVREVNTLDAGIAWKAHVNQLTNNCLIHVNGCLAQTMQQYYHMKYQRALAYQVEKTNSILYTAAFISQNSYSIHETK